MNEALRYSYSVEYDAEDDIFIARVKEFPSLATHATTSPVVALRSLIFLVAEVLENTHEVDTTLPKTTFDDTPKVINEGKGAFYPGAVRTPPPDVLYEMLEKNHSAGCLSVGGGPSDDECICKKGEEDGQV